MPCARRTVDSVRKSGYHVATGQQYRDVGMHCGWTCQQFWCKPAGHNFAHIQARNVSQGVTLAAFALPPPVLAEAAAVAFCASALLPPVRAFCLNTAAAVCASALPPPVLAEAAAAAFCASALPPPVRAFCLNAAAAVCASALPPPVRAFCWGATCLLDSHQRWFLSRPRLLRCQPGIGALVVQVRQSTHILRVVGHQANNAFH